MQTSTLVFFVMAVTFGRKRFITLTMAACFIKKFTVVNYSRRKKAAWNNA
jgi:hypothetical protein